MKCLILSSSRADYGIYRPLLREMTKDTFFDLTVFAFGMHCSEQYGLTYKEIEIDGFNVFKATDALIYGDNSSSIALTMSKVTEQVAEYLKSNNFDLIICLGDRFEMMSAVVASIPFMIPIVHLHGGELSEGAIDQKYRSAITKLSDLHFVSCEKYKNRVIQMGVSSDRVFNVGSLGVESIHSQTLLTSDEIRAKFGIDMEKDTILFTFHPVTAELDKITHQLKILEEVITKVDKQFVITLGNADHESKKFHDLFNELGKKHPDRIKVFKSLGSQGYFSVMKLSKLVMGNSSSGILESATLGVPCINLGNRQKGREINNNTIQCQMDLDSIYEAIKTSEKMDNRTFKNMYEGKNTAKEICRIIKATKLTIDFTFCDLN